jgi:hypothetical protein
MKDIVNLQHCIVVLTYVFIVLPSPALNLGLVSSCCANCK